MANLPPRAIPQAPEGGVSEHFSNHPMQPRNPHTGPWCEPPWKWTAGAGRPQQLQVWIAGPNTAGGALVILTNVGPDEHPHTRPEKSGTFLTTWTGIACRWNFNQLIQWCIEALGTLFSNKTIRVWLTVVNLIVSHSMSDGRAARPPAAPLPPGKLSAELGPWESVMYAFAKTP